MAAGDPLLGRAVWTDADFDQMGWHDVRVHAIGFFEDDLETPAELALDIDYIVRWIDPEPPDEYFTFDIAPATLVFSDVWGLEGELQAFQRTLLTIDGIERGEPESELQEQKGMRRGLSQPARSNCVSWRAAFRSTSVPVQSSQGTDSGSQVMRGAAIRSSVPPRFQRVSPSTPPRMRALPVSAH
jgi:hypothetical protein